MEPVSREFRTRLVSLLRSLPDLDTENRRSALLTYLPPGLTATIPRDPSPAIDLANIVAACAAWEPSNPTDPHPLALLLATARSLAPPAHQPAWEALIADAPAAVGPVPVVVRPRLPWAVGRGGLLLGGLGIIAAALALTFGILLLIQPPPPPLAATPVPSAGEDMVPIAAGPYVLGTDDSQADESEKPPTPVLVEAFQIDRHEVTNTEYRRCYDASKHCSVPMSDPTTFTLAQYDDYPVVHVTAEQAARYCAWRGARLPREEEWERAVRGPGTDLTALRPWPWRSTPATPNPTVANIYPPASTIQPVGKHPAGNSPEGVEDLIGNVWEWTSSYYTLGGYGNGPDPWDWTGGALTGETLVQRGGSFQSGIARSTTRRAAGWSDEDVDVGFRCVRQLP